MRLVWPQHITVTGVCFHSTRRQSRKWPRCSVYIFKRSHLCLLLHCAPGHFLFPWRHVRKCLFLRRCLALLWRPIGMPSLVAAACKNRKQSSQQGVKQIHTIPNSVFSLHLSLLPLFFLPRSFILPHTHRIRGLCHVLGKRVLMFWQKPEIAASGSLC